MPKCPKCGEEISYFIAEETTQFEVTYLEEVDELDWTAWEAKIYKFRCPECDEVVFGATDDAKNFLKGVET